MDLGELDQEDDDYGDETYMLSRKRNTKQKNKKGIRKQRNTELLSSSILKHQSIVQPLLDNLTVLVEGDDNDEDEVSFDTVIQDLLPELIQTRAIARERETIRDEFGNFTRPLSRLEANLVLANLNAGENPTPMEALVGRKLKLERHKHLSNLNPYLSFPKDIKKITPLEKTRVASAPNAPTLDALYAIRTTPHQNSFLARLQGFYMDESPGVISCDWESRTPWMELMGDIRYHYTFAHPEFEHPVEPEAPIKYGSLQPHHVAQIHELLTRLFWTGIDVSDSFDYKPERCTVIATYKRLVVGAAILSSPQETYITYLAVRAGWDNSQIATTMLYHLITLNPRKDITLHVSTNNPAMLLYNRFGFKAEGFIAGFYEDYLDPHSRASKNAFRLRLRQ